MNIIINASNLKEGGGIQVADSLCRELYRYGNHCFIVVLSSKLGYLSDVLKEAENVKTVTYDIPHSVRTVVTGRDLFLDDLVRQNQVDGVLTVFGPSIWRPKIAHLCGFARAQLLLLDSPYYHKIGVKERIKFKIWYWLFKTSAHHFYTENSYISDLLQKSYSGTRVFTVSNYYNQIYDQQAKWKLTKTLPSFEGTTCLSISTHYPHKNFEILIHVAQYLSKEKPEFKVRFVLTFQEKEMHVPENLKHFFCFIGKVAVSECPYLYEQSDIMFMPTLMECFTATYPEAMRMGKPIVTTDLEFAHGLCEDAACYYSAVDAKAAAEAIYKVATDKNYAESLVLNGREQLKKFDSYRQRADKLINIMEIICSDNIIKK